MSGRINWSHPRYQRQGKRTEDINGNGVPAEFRTTPRSLPRPKEDMRREAEAALREFMKRQPVKEDLPLPPTTGKPPWED
jgi:hypothetical protein